MFRSLLHTSGIALSSALVRAVSAPSLPLPPPSAWRQCVCPMSLRASAAVKEWVNKQNPRLFQFLRSSEGHLRPPRLSRRKQAHVIKRAIKDGEIVLEPTVMPPLTTFKGHKRERDRPVRQALVEAKMKEMPKLIADYREAQRAARAKRRLENRFK